MADRHGLLVIDKPPGITSRAVVNQIQMSFPAKTRIGHAGTLDPAATGVLVVCVGKATRLVEYVQCMEKEYLAEFTLGATSSTDDTEGEIREQDVTIPPNRLQVEGALSTFVGKIQQIPPAFSAAKVGGRRAYQTARSGKRVDLQPRTIRIHAIEVLNFRYPSIQLTIRCGKGTYIRSLARDLGAYLGCGGYVISLRRTRVGVFHENQAVKPADAAIAQQPLLSIEFAVADLPAIEISADAATRLSSGRAIPLSRQVVAESDIAVKCNGRLLAIGRLDEERANIQPVKVLVKQN